MNSFKQILKDLLLTFKILFILWLVFYALPVIVFCVFAGIVGNALWTANLL